MMVRGQRLGWAALVCSVVGMVGWHGLPLLQHLLEGMGWNHSGLQRGVQLTQAWLTPGTLVALVVGTVGLFRFQFRLALVGLVVALATAGLPVLLKIYGYLLQQ